MNLCNIFKNKTNEGANVPIYVKNEIEDLSSAISVFKESDFNNDKKTYIVDTNVIIQNPRFMTDFNSCNIILPIIALEELEKLKGKMGSNSGYRSRKFIRMLKESKIIDKDLINGVDYINDITIGTVFKYDVDNLPDILDKNYGDNKILGLDIFKKNKNCCLLTADISMAVKATAFGISVEIYDKGDMGKVKDLESGYMEVEVDEFIIDKAYEDKFISYNSLAYYIKDTDDEIFPNKYFIIKANNGSKKSFLGRFIESEGKIVKLSSESDKGVFYGMSAKDVQQKFMIDALLDDSIKLLTVTAEPGSGKAQPMYSKILTPNGFVQMKDIKVGDYVIGRNGEHVKVKGVYPQGVIDNYRITLADGSTTECNGEHLWTIQADRGKERTISLNKMLETFATRNKPFRIPINKAVEFNKENDIKHILHPYVLGVLIGDGYTSFGTSGVASIGISNSEEDIFEKVASLLPEGITIVEKNDKNYSRNIVNKSNYKDNIVKKELERLNLRCKAGEKGIPMEYLLSSKENRMHLLQGLMDTDGSVRLNKKGYRYSTTSKELKDDFMFLVRSLGYRATCRVDIREGRTDCYDISVLTGDCIVSSKKNLSRKETWNNQNPDSWRRKDDYITIKNIEYIGKEDMQCIMVDSDDHLYLTDNFIVTHNTFVSLAVGMELAIEQNKYDKLLIGKNTAPLDNWSYQGFVPGTQEDKLMTHFANYMTTLENLEKAKGSLVKKKTKDSNIQLSGKDLLLKKISEGRLEMLDIASILGSSFEDKFIIIDEAQGFDAHAMRSIITRVGKGCKLVIIGDLNQQVISHLDPDKSGLFCAVEWLKELDSTAHITLKNVHRGSFVKDVAGIFDRKMFS